MPEFHMRQLLAFAILVCLLRFPASADDSSALINEALDKIVSLQVNGPLPEVVKKITDQTAVPITVAPEVYELLPWGDQTNVGAKIENETLRQALTEITRRMGLTF